MKSVIYLGKQEDTIRTLSEEVAGINLTTCVLDKEQIPASTPLQPDCIIVDLRSSFDPAKVASFWEMLISSCKEISLLYICQDETFQEHLLPFQRDSNFDLIFCPFTAKELSYRINKQNTFITDRKSLQDPKQTSKAFNSFPLPIFYQNSQEQILNVNPAFERCFGYTEKEIVGKNFQDLQVSFTSDSAESTHSDLSSTIHAEYSIPGRFIDKKLILHTTALADSNEQKDYTMGVILDITESQKHIDSLEEQKTVAENINKIRSRFLSNISQQIRTPVNAIIGFSELLRITLPVEDETQEFVETIESSAQSLLDSLNNILDIAQIESGDKKLDYSRVCLRTLIHEILMHFEAISHKKNLELNFNFANKFPEYVLADYRRLKQVLTNLVGNAIKNTNDGSISLTLAQTPTVSSKHINMEISVTDTGTGLSPEQKAQINDILDKPHKLSNASAETFSFGLAISNAFIRMMNGTIKLEDSSEKGSTFKIQIPEIEAINKRICPQQLHETHGQFKIDPNAKILIADSQIFNLELISNYLKQLGLYNIYETRKSTDLIKHINSTPFDLIIVDLYLDDYPAIELLKHIKKSDKNHLSPVISISNKETDYLNFSLLSYCSALLIKPLSLKKFCNTVTQHCLPIH